MESSSAFKVGVIHEPTLEASLQVYREIQGDVDDIELRLDAWPVFNIDTVKAFLDRIQLPCLLTLPLLGSQADYAERLKVLTTLGARYLDVDASMPGELLQCLKALAPEQKIIRSCHIDHMPADLSALAARLRSPWVDYIKIVPTTENTCEALDFLIFMAREARQSSIIGHCQGQQGAFTRLLAPSLGSQKSYFAPTPRAWRASGMFDLETIKAMFPRGFGHRYRSFYGLIGNPVYHSRGDYWHNEQFAKQGRQSIYVKMLVQHENIDPFLDRLQGLPFRGLSVTAPLKVSMSRHWQSQRFRALNTVKFTSAAIEITNTDTLAVTDLMRQKILLQGKRILILGAGGVAIGLIPALLGEGAVITLLNRRQSRAQALAARYGIQLGIWESNLICDVIINTAPCEQPYWHHIRRYVHQDVLVVDFLYVGATLLKCLNGVIPAEQCISGSEIFIQQARYQQAFWAQD